MTWICYIGIEISARTQFVLLAHRDLDPRAVRGGRAVEGLRQRRARLGPRRSQLVLPLRPAGRNDGAGQRGAARRLHLLGMGQRRLRQRGVTRRRQRPRQGGGDEHDSAGADLRRRRRGSAGLPRPALSHQQRRRRARRARPQRARLPARQAADHHGADLRLGLDPDDDPADGPHHALDGSLRLDPASRSVGSTPAT